ncbi:helix-turn-helix domain-containing protein [Prevotella sp. E9-3]|uniref:helix-turn-helix domain-containing protein n=1 Tax=Prevotella sp. E9-3 TaxID=2913621 RepID=UPI001EDB0F0F|nr:helix-turn-helix domain-containing protein [Prevotella sp. E9-3]UKK48312.1 helix-turn-helix domain-containing protein [Prevotella sp. E9-3]
MNKRIIETNFSKVKQWTNCLAMEDDILLIDRLTEAPFPKSTRRLNFILICLCTKGEVTYTLDTVEQRLTPGDLLVVSERHVLDKYNASPDFDGLCMMMSMPIYNEIVRNVGDASALFLFSHNHPIFPLTAQSQKTFKDYFYIIRKKVGDTGNHFRRNLVAALLLAMLYDLSNVVYQSSSKRDIHQTRADVIFNQFIRMVEDNCRQERRVTWYAEQLNITPKYLAEMVKQVSMRTPNEWIDRYVTIEIRVMLRNSSMSIKDITKALNFPNQSFLGKYFKEHVGMSPSQYRRG